MNAFRTNVFRAAVLLAAGSLMSACMTQTDSKIDYRSTTKATPLEVPPGLTDYDKNTKYNLSTVVSANDIAQQPSGSNTAAGAPVLVAAQDMFIERAGNTRWLVVKRPAETLWPSIQSFWEQTGFTLRVNQPNIGIMETDWAENRANLPATGLRKVLGKALDAIYDSGTRDMYRTRVEKVSGGVEIYISHRGMEEVYTSSSKESTVWQPRAEDPELEVELLRRLMVALGTNDAAAKAAVQNATDTTKSARIDGDTLIVNDSVENSWRRVSQVLDRVGLSITDRDISQRVYIVTPNPDDRGLFSKSFGKLKESYQVRFVALPNNQTQVRFADKMGQPYSDAGLSKVLKKLQDSLK